MDLDAVSMLVTAPGTATLAEVEDFVRPAGLTLDLAPTADAASTVEAFLASGAPGSRDAWRDPADHLVAGLEARLRDGRVLVVRPGPRRAVGPDLVALFVGMDGRCGVVVRATLRVHALGVRRPDASAFRWPRDPVVTPEEERLLRAITDALASPSPRRP